MDTDSSLLILDESSSFQLLDQSEKSESFVVLDPCEPVLNDIASHYDVEDEWLQIESGSVISDMASIIKPDGSIMSEYSMLILDNMHSAALNEGGKLIKTRPDIYVEDQTMRKVLEYISMFSEDVSSYLKSFKSHDSLISSQVMMADWEISSLIDLDDISTELLGILLDTLEEFGMYKLCLIVCNRYSLASRLGRYVVSLATKYSNLHQLKFNDLRGSVQVQRAAIAYTAVHNIFEMIHPDYLTLSEDSNKSLGVEAFRGLLLLGYWKKTVYIMDYENSLAVTQTFGDYKNFKQVLFARKNLKIDIKDNFDWTQYIQPNETNYWKIALDSVITNLNGLKSVTQNKTYINYNDLPFPTFPPRFQYNKALWECFLKQSGGFKPSIKALLPQILKDLKSPCTDPVVLHDAFTFLAQVLTASGEPIILEALTELSFEDFEIFLEASNIFFRELGVKLHPKDPKNLFSILSCFGIREIIPSSVTSVYPFLTHALVHRSSIILSAISSLSDYYIPDLEANYTMVSIYSIIQILLPLLISKLSAIIKSRSDAYIASSPKDLETRTNLFGEIWMLDFIKNQVNYSYNKLSSYNYCRLDNKLQEEYKSLQTELQKILYLGEADYYTEMYIRIEKNPQIKKIEKRMREIEKISQSKDVLKREEALLCLVKLAQVTLPKLSITRISRLGLLTEMQVYTSNADTGSSMIIHKNMWIVYQLSRISGYTQYYIEMLQSRYRKVLIHGKKFPKVSGCYETPLGYVDIDVYFCAGEMKEAVNTILEILEIDWTSIELETKLLLLYKAVIAWVISNVDEFQATYNAFNVIWNSVAAEDCYEIFGPASSKFSPSKIMVWLIDLIKEYAYTEGIEAHKKRAVVLIYEMIFLIYRYNPEYDVISYLKNIDNVSNLDLIAEATDNKFLFDVLASIRTESDFIAFKKTRNFEDGIVFRVKSRKSDDKVQEFLDNEWFKEVRSIAVHKQSCIIIRKHFGGENGKIKLNNMGKYKTTNPSDSIFKYYCPGLLMPLAKIVLGYYRELNQLFYRIPLTKVLDFHHLLSKYVQLGDLMVKIKNWTPTAEEINKLIEHIKEDAASFNNWKKIISPTIENPGTSLKKKYKMKWPARSRFSRRRHY